MPVDTKHDAYGSTVDQWKRCRDAFAGTDAVKAAGETYLPKLRKQADDEYRDYKARAVWFGATERTVGAFVGSVFRKEPAINGLPDPLTPHVKDIALNGQHVYRFAAEALKEVLTVGRHGVLVDMPAAGPEKRPYWVSYFAEQIINWRTARVNGKTVLSLVVLQESDEQVNPEDPFVVECVTKYRVLKLDDGGKYIQQLWEAVEETGPDGQKSESFRLVEEIFPTRKGARLDFIPFAFLNARNNFPEIDKPPLLDLVDVNFSHYRTSADLEHGRHFCGLPTPWAKCFNVAQGQELRIGSAVAWTTDDPNADVGMLEFTGQGLAALEKAEAEKKQAMSELGSAFAQRQRDGVEAAETVRMKFGEEHASLTSVVESVSSGLTQAMQWHMWWFAGDGAKADDVSFKLNGDFFDISADPRLLDSLMSAVQAGFISRETYYWNLQQGEIARPGVDWESERKAIEAEEPMVEDVAPAPEVEEEDEPEPTGARR